MKCVKYNLFSITSATLLSFFAFSCFANAEDAVAVDAPPPRLIITEENRADVFSVPMLGRKAKEVVIYRGAGAKEDTPHYFQPALLPDWRSYTREFDESCIENGYSYIQKDKISEIELSIRVNSKEYRNQLAALILERGKISSFKENNFYFIPYDFMLIALKFDEKERIIFSTREGEHFQDLQKAYRSPREASIEEYISIPLELSCAEHDQIINKVKKGDRNLLKASLFRTDLIYESVNFHAFASLELGKYIEASLFSDEATSIKVKSEANGRGLNASFSIPFFPISASGGAGHSDATVSQDALRLVTRDVFEEVSSKINIQKNASCIGKEDKCIKIMESVLPSLINPKFDEAIFAQAKDGYVIVGKQLDYVTIKNNRITGELKSAFETLGKSKQSGNVKIVKGLEAGFEDQYENKANQAGAGKLIVDAPIATVADVAVLSRNSFKQKVALAITLEIPEDNSQNPIAIKFIYPAKKYTKSGGLSPEEIENRDIRRFKCINNERWERSDFHSDKKRWAEAKAGPGRYIESFTIHNTTNTGNKPRIRTRIFKGRTVYFQVDEFQPGKNRNKLLGMIKEKKVKFRCKGRKKRVTCSASGYIATIQQPLECAEFLVPEYEDCCSQ